MARLETESRHCRLSHQRAVLALGHLGGDRDPVLQAKRLPETLQTWRISSLGETWEDQGETVALRGCWRAANLQRRGTCRPR